MQQPNFGFQVLKLQKKVGAPPIYSAPPPTVITPDVHMGGYEHLPPVTATWPEPLLEDARLGLALPRWAQRELRSPVIPPASARPPATTDAASAAATEPLRLVSVTQEENDLRLQIQALGEEEFHGFALRRCLTCF